MQEDLRKEFNLTFGSDQYQEYDFDIERAYLYAYLFIKYYKP